MTFRPPFLDAPFTSVSPVLPSPNALAAVRAWWRGLWVDELTRHLSQSIDPADLERRLRTWEDASRRPWLPPR